MVEETAVVWQGFICIVTVTILRRFLQVAPCQQRMGKSPGKAKTLGPANLGPIMALVCEKPVGLTEQEHGWKNLELYSAVMWNTHLHLHKLQARYETISEDEPIICG